MFFLAVLLGILAGCAGGGSEKEELKKITIAEPVHLTGYLPLYAAIHEGYFEEEGLDVEVVTATGGAHVTTVVSGDAWGISPVRIPMHSPISTRMIPLYRSSMSSIGPMST